MESTVAKMIELQKKHSENLPIPLEAAYGIAYRHEIVETKATNASEKALVVTEKVYQLADERMYAMKAKMKSELARR